MEKAERRLLLIGLGAVAFCLAIIFFLDHRIKVKLEAEKIAAEEFAKAHPSPIPVDGIDKTATDDDSDQDEDPNGAGAHPFVQIINQALEQEDQQTEADAKAAAESKAATPRQSSKHDRQ